jgi:hypothetical protein
MERIMSMFRDNTAFRVIAAVAALFCGAGIAPGKASDAHRDGFTPYARVDRLDGTYRMMLIDNRSLEALGRGEAADRATILMESFSGDDLTTVFAKTREGSRWLYGSIQPGQTILQFRPGPSCATCHRVAGAGGNFTQAMLERFVKTSTLQTTFCSRSGRSPCEPEVYGQSSELSD